MVNPLTTASLLIMLSLRQAEPTAETPPPPPESAQQGLVEEESIRQAIEQLEKRQANLTDQLKKLTTSLVDFHKKLTAWEAEFSNTGSSSVSNQLLEQLKTTAENRQLSIARRQQAVAVISVDAGRTNIIGATLDGMAKQLGTSPTAIPSQLMSINGAVGALSKDAENFAIVVGEGTSLHARANAVVAASKQMQTDIEELLATPVRLHIKALKEDQVSWSVLKQRLKELNDIVDGQPDSPARTTLKEALMGISINIGKFDELVRDQQIEIHLQQTSSHEQRALKLRAALLAMDSGDSFSKFRELETNLPRDVCGSLNAFKTVLLDEEPSLISQLVPIGDKVAAYAASNPMLDESVRQRLNAFAGEFDRTVQELRNRNESRKGKLPKDLAELTNLISFLTCGDATNGSPPLLMVNVDGDTPVVVTQETLYQHRQGVAENLQRLSNGLRTVVVYEHPTRIAAQVARIEALKTLSDANAKRPLDLLKGFLAIPELRWHALHAIVAQDKRSRSILNEITQDKLADIKIRRVALNAIAGLGNDSLSDLSSLAGDETMANELRIVATESIVNLGKVARGKNDQKTMTAVAEALLIVRSSAETNPLDEFAQRLALAADRGLESLLTLSP